MSHIRELYLQIKSFFYIDGTTNLNIFGKLAVSLLIFLITIFLAKVVTKFVFEKFLMVKTKKIQKCYWRDHSRKNHSLCNGEHIKVYYLLFRNITNT